MIKINDDLLQELNLGSLPPAEKDGLLKHIYETLEMRVGMRLADQMTNEQLDEFEQYFEAKDDAGAFKWLETNFPNYKDIVQEEFDKLKVEVGQAAPQILAASQAQAAQSQPAQAQPPVAPVPPVATPAPTPTDPAPVPQPMPQSPPMPPAQPQPMMPPPQPSTPPMPVQPQQNDDVPSQQPPAGPGQDQGQAWPPQQAA